MQYNLVSFNLENRIAVLREYEYLKAGTAFVQSLSELIWKHYSLYRAWRRWKEMYLLPLCLLNKITIQQILDWPEIQLKYWEWNEFHLFFYSYIQNLGDVGMFCWYASGSTLCQTVRPVCCVLLDDMPWSLFLFNISLSCRLQIPTFIVLLISHACVNISSSWMCCFLMPSAFQSFA